MIDHTYMVINDTPGNEILFKSTSSMISLDLSHMKLVIFLGCETGAGGENTNNLPKVAVQKGATVAIGFDKVIYQDEIEDWSKAFFEQFTNGTTVSKACENLDGLFREAKAVVCGNGSITFN